MLRFDLLRSSYLQKCRPNSPEVEAKIRSGRSQRSFEKPATAPSKVGHWPWCPGGWTKPSTSRHVATLVTFSNDLIWFNASWRIYWHLNQFWAFLLCLCKVNLRLYLQSDLKHPPVTTNQVQSNCQIVKLSNHFSPSKFDIAASASSMECVVRSTAEAAGLHGVIEFLWVPFKDQKYQI